MNKSRIACLFVIALGAIGSTASAQRLNNNRNDAWLVPLHDIWFSDMGGWRGQLHVGGMTTYTDPKLKRIKFYVREGAEFDPSNGHGTWKRLEKVEFVSSFYDYDQGSRLTFVVRDDRIPSTGIIAASIEGKSLEPWNREMPPSQPPAGIWGTSFVAANYDEEGIVALTPDQVRETAASRSGRGANNIIPIDWRRPLFFSGEAAVTRIHTNTGFRPRNLSVYLVNGNPPAHNPSGFGMAWQRFGGEVVITPQDDRAYDIGYEAGAANKVMIVEYSHTWIGSRTTYEWSGVVRDIAN